MTRVDRRMLSRAPLPALQRLARFVGVRAPERFAHHALVEVLVRRLDRIATRCS